MATGRVVSWMADRGYGFISPDAGGNDVFLHVGELAPGCGLESIRPGTRVQFQLVNSGRGPKATGVQLESPAPGPAPVREDDGMADFIPAAQFQDEVSTILADAVSRLVALARRYGWVG